MVFLALGFVSYVPLVVFLFLIIAGFGLTRETLFKNYMNKHIESSNRATVLSTVSMIKRLVDALLYPLIGYLAEVSLNNVLIGIGVLMIASALIARTQEDHLLD